MNEGSTAVLMLARYGELGASSRVRMFQYAPVFEASRPALKTVRQSLLDDDYLRRKYAGRPTAAAVLRGYAGRVAALLRPRGESVWWLEKELWPWMPAAVERLLLARRPYALDIDDAIFHQYDLHESRLVRRLYGRKIDALMRSAALVTAGNDYLAERARRAGARRVEIVPTVVDVDVYRPAGRTPHGGPVRIVWIGSPATVHYLRLVEGALGRLAAQREIVLRVVGARIELRGVTIESVPWTQTSEALAIAEADVGIMPLPDSPWERGKCGYKLVQYSACGLPVVASPVGVNTQIVADGESGLLAADEAQWVEALRRLVDDAGLRVRLGQAGRRRAEREYSLQAVAPRLAALLRSVHVGER